MNRPVTQKQKPFRIKDYTDWVKSFPCSVCATDQCIEPHHLKGHGHSGTRKADDRLTMPLCSKHHRELHDHGYQSFDKKYKRMNEPAQIYYVNLTLGRAKIQKALTSEQVAEARELIKV